VSSSSTLCAVHSVHCGMRCNWLCTRTTEHFFNEKAIKKLITETLIKRMTFQAFRVRLPVNFAPRGSVWCVFSPPHVNLQCCGQARHSMKPREVVHGALPEQARTKLSPEGDLGRWHVYFRCGHHIGWSPYPNFRTIFHCFALQKNSSRDNTST
jgi:hypothetical protein